MTAKRIRYLKIREQGRVYLVRLLREQRHQVYFGRRVDRHGEVMLPIHVFGPRDVVCEMRMSSCGWLKRMEPASIKLFSI